ncbi:MAG: hypothetical protein E7425_01980 [Ruminococcaceae bacterium]|nr:hypothetical protein [Oscillospiraceae bacterium]
MKQRNRFLSILLTFCMIAGLMPWSALPARADGTLAGSGTEADPYVINSVDDWNTFADSGNAGTYWGSGVYVRLGADIPTADDIAAGKSVTTMAGADGSNCFRGTFDGQGHTLSVNLTHTGGGDAFAAPFKFLNGATIRRLHTAGTITTDGKMSAGIVGDVKGSVTIQNCRSSVTISTSVSGDGTHGGFAGRVESGNTLTVTNCLFDGAMTGSSTNRCGGFVGWKDGSLTLDHCLQAGDLSGIDSEGGATFHRANSDFADFTTCYYRTAYGTVQGTQTDAAGNDLLTLLGDGWEVSGENVVPVVDARYLALATVSGLQPAYAYTGAPIDVAYTVRSVSGETLQKGTDFTETITPSPVRAIGDYTLTIVGAGVCSGTRSFSFRVYDAMTGMNAVANGDTVWFGRDYTDAPIAWRVLSAAGDAALPVSDAKHALLISKDLLFDENWDDGVASSSVAKSFFGSLYANWPNDAEKAAITATSVTEETISYDDGNMIEELYLGHFDGASLYDEHFFFLSAREADTYFDGDDDRRVYYLPVGHVASEPNAWWLRSPYVDNEYNILEGLVDRDGSLFYDFYESGVAGVRPAFNLNPESVLFASPAAGGKTDDNSAIAPLPLSTTNEWKLTLLDSGRTGFAVTEAPETVESGGTVSLTCSGAQDGKNEFVSVLLCDADGATVGYGSVPAAQDGTAAFTLPDSLTAGSYTLKVFNEQRNGDHESNYAGNLVEVALTVTKRTITPAVTLESWTYGETAKEPTVTGNVGNGTVTYAYKVKGAEDAAYSAEVPVNAGEYTIRATVAETETSFGGTATADFAISRAQVTVKANDAAKYCGKAEPMLTATVTGLIGSDTINYTVTRAAGEAAGTYAITSSGDTVQGNYTVTYQAGTFTIYGAKGDWKDDKLVATVTLPENANALLVAASCDSTGRQVGIKVIEIKADQTVYETGLAKTTGYTYKLMLVSKTTYAPLCKAWVWPE